LVRVWPDQALVRAWPDQALVRAGLAVTGWLVVTG
jgi:hypothetical protein